CVGNINGNYNTNATNTKNSHNVTKNSHNTINVNTDNTDNSVNFNVVFFPNDGINNITCDELINFQCANIDLVQWMIENINLNPKKPQHHNIYYSDTKSANGEVYVEKGW